jgi:hypothetical protein
MLLPVFTGQNYSYSLDTKLGEYCLFENNHKSHAFLKGKDADILRKQMDYFDSLPEPKYKTGLMTEDLIKFFCE